MPALPGPRLLFALALAFAALTLPPGAARAGEARLALEPSSRVVLEGSTNLHDWSCESTALALAARINLGPAEALAAVEALEGRAEREGALKDPPVPPDLRAAFELSIPVQGLQCGNRRMERDLARVLQADRRPAIRYRFHGVEEAAWVPSERGGRPRLVLVVEGEIALAGARRRVIFPVESRRVGDDRFELRGRVPMTMTEFGLDPPVALLGLLRARDRLTVEVDLLLRLEEPRAGSGAERHRSGAGVEAHEPLP